MIGCQSSRCVEKVTHEDPEHPGEAGGLHRRGHERHDRGGRALVHVGRPGVERRRRDLEAEADQHQADAGEQQALVGEAVGGQEVGDADQVGGAGGAVDQGDAVQEERRGEAAEHEVLQGGLARAHPAAVHAGEHVDRDGEDLEAEEQDDEVLGRGHDDAAGGRQQEEDERLGALEVLPAQVAVGEEAGDDHAHRDHRDQEEGEAVDRVGPAHHGAGARLRQVAPQQHAGEDRAQRGGDRGDGGPADGAAAGQEPAEGEQQGRPGHHDEERRERRPGDAGGVDASSTVGEQQRAHGWPSSASAPSAVAVGGLRLGVGLLAGGRALLVHVGLLEVGVVLDVGHQGGDRGLDPLEERLRVDAEEHDEAEQRRQHEALAETELGEAPVVVVGLAVEDPLVGPQQVQGGEDHAGGGHDRPPPGGGEGPQQDEELADEAVEAGQADRRQHHEGEHAGEDRRDLLEALEAGRSPGCGGARRSSRPAGTGRRWRCRG